jgi:hypothetical protein
MSNHLEFYNHPDDEGAVVVSVNIDYLDNSYPIQDFIRGDIQIDTKSCLTWIKTITEAENTKDFFYDSFGNCCTATVTFNGVDIENEYTEDKARNIHLADMKLILEKWLDFTKTREPIEFSW